MEYLESSVRISNGEFPYIRFGTGKKNLVMLAGMSMTGLAGLGEPVSEMYRDYVEEYTVYVFDRLRVLPDDASVRSMAQDTAEAMQALGIKKADVTGASQGGMIALVLAIDHPELVHALIPCSSCCYPNEIAKETFSVWSALANKGMETGFTGTILPGSIRSRMKQRSPSALIHRRMTSADISEFSPAPATISTAGTNCTRCNALCLCWARRRIGCWAAHPRPTLQRVWAVSASFIRTTDTRFAMKLRTFGKGCWTSCTRSYDRIKGRVTNVSENSSHFPLIFV